MFFKKRKSPEVEVSKESFIQRVDQFWSWFAENSQRLLDGIDNQEFDALVPEVSDQVKAMAPLAWVFGPPPEGATGHSFTLTPEGNAYKQHIIEFVLSRRPELENWTFYNSKQPANSVDGISIDVMGEKLTAQEFWVVATPNAERKKVDLKLWHPLFAKLSERDQQQLTFIWLDESLGEFVVENQIGHIDISPEGLEESFPINELKEVFYKQWDEAGWTAPDPTLIYAGYSINEDALKPDRIRGDVYMGSTCLFQLVSDFIKTDGQMEHPTPDIGIEFFFLAMPIENFTAGEPVQQRSEVEDALEAALSADLSGKVVGGAAGTKFMYLDIMAFHPQQALRHIQETAANSPYAKNAELRFFDKDRIAGQLPL